MTKRQKSLLKARSYSPQQRWQIDYDYLDQLSEEELEWLAQFNSEYYDGSAHKQVLHSDEHKKGNYLRKRAARRDLLGWLLSGPGVEGTEKAEAAEEAVQRDFSVWPAPDSLKEYEKKK